MKNMLLGYEKIRYRAEQEADETTSKCSTDFYADKTICFIFPASVLNLSLRTVALASVNLNVQEHGVCLCIHTDKVKN